MLSMGSSITVNASSPQSLLLRGNDVLPGATHALLSGFRGSASLLCTSAHQRLMLSARRYYPARCILSAQYVPSPCHAGEKAAFCILAQRSYASWATVERDVCGWGEESKLFHFASFAAGVSSSSPRVVSEYRPAFESCAGRASADSCRDAHAYVSCTEGEIAARCSASRR
jgi:hypothetical protein